MKEQDVVWKDRKRILGMPISFTKYYIKNNRLYMSAGLFSNQEDEIMLYKIMDLRVNISLLDRIFRVGTVTIYSRDESNREMKLLKIKHPKKVRDMLSEKVESLKKNMKIQGREMYGAAAHEHEYEYADEDYID
ncbi:MAG: PH domain-containing protein [Clostridium sp.]|nr:PH domain-containing protein [Clostridium sp.]MDY3828626.1 PH domain-containing protein [Clostridium sp.]